MDPAKWESHATVVTYALDNGTVNDEIVKAVLALTEMRDEEGSLDAEQLSLLQVCVRVFMSSAGTPKGRRLRCECEGLSYH